MKNVLGRIIEFFVGAGSGVVQGLRLFGSRVRNMWSQPTLTWGRPDYAFWRRAFYAQAAGLDLSGLFIRPLVSKICAWTLGRAPNWKMDSGPAAEALTTWWGEHHAEILEGWRSSLKQGDAFLVVNADLSLTLLMPDTVEPIVADDDYRNVIGWKVTQVLQHPTRAADRMTIVDEYFISHRIHTVSLNGAAAPAILYPNLIGRLPIIHIPNSPADGETFGHAEAEAMVRILQRYGEVLDAALDGNIRQGRPTPVISFETEKDMTKFWAMYGRTETIVKQDGTTETTDPILDVDLNAIVTLSAATFDYKFPGSFSQDTERLLGLLFYLILEHTELPEFVFGNAIASSKASADTQMPIFIKYVEMRRGQMAAWLVELAEVVLAYLSVITPGLSADKPTIQWESLSQQDGRLNLDTIIWAYSEGLLDDETAVMLSGLEIDDIKAMLAKAKAQREERMAEAQALAPAPIPGPANTDNPPIDPTIAKEIAAIEGMLTEQYEEAL